MSRIALLLLVLITLRVSAEELTLEQAVAAALEKNAGVQNAQLEIEKAQTRIDAAKTRRLPAFEVSMIGGEALNNISIEIEETGDRIDLARTWSMIGVARITQPLTQLHSINLGVKLHEASLAADRERERAA
ncbi:MAG TPA: TolC family protein, partial [Thermoanaerobaculia bacterium]|nr:TolC family protein [Thermoanaerobaculia bacterium]